MRWIVRSWVVLSLLFSGINAFATDYYVNPVDSTYGDDGVGIDTTARDGLSPNTAWATLSYAFTRITSGTNNTINIMEGVLTDNLDWNQQPGTDYIVIPSALDDLTIEGSGPSSTVFDPSTFPTWKHFYIFTANGNSNLTIRNLGLVDGRAFLLANNTTGTLTVDNVSIQNPVVGSYGNLPPIHVHGHTGDVAISDITTSGTRSDGDGIDSYGGGSILVHDVSGDVSLSNITADGCVAPWMNGGAFCINNVGGSLDIENVVATNNQSSGNGGAFYIGTVFGPVSISNVNFTSPYSQYGSGGAIAVNDARSTVTISNISITGGYANQDGAGIAIQNVRDRLTLTGMSISSNDIIWGTGGAISIKTLLASGLHVTVSNSTLSGNSANSSNGGALAVNGTNADDDTLTMNNLVIKDNTAGTWGDGGGFWVEKVSVVELLNSTIKNNSLSESNNGYSGGGGYIHNVENLVVDNVAFIENTSNGNGGGLAVPNANNVNDTQTYHQVAFIDNEADGNKWTGDGGGLYTTQAGNVTVDYALFAGNYASDDGGAMLFDRFNNNSALHISSITMAYNEAVDDGSAILNTQALANDSLTIDNSIVWANGDTSRTVDPATLSTEDAIEGNLNNLDVSFSNVQTSDTSGYSADGNLNVDPFFSDPTANDYSVLPGSPMIDQGDSTSSVSEEAEPNNGIINIGYTPPTTIDPVTGETIAAPVGSTAEPVSVGTVTAASLASIRSYRNKYMMMGSPVVPDPSKHFANPDSAWGDDLNGTSPGIADQTWRFSRFINKPDTSFAVDTTTYVGFFGYVRQGEPEQVVLNNVSYDVEIHNPPPIHPGYGYWFVYGDGAYTKMDKAVRDTTVLGIGPAVAGGMVSGGTSPYVLPLDPKPSDTAGYTNPPPFGYNMMANPWPFPISWQDVRFGTSASGPWVTPTEAATSGWVDAYAITWDNVNLGYVPKTGQLAPWEGFWVIVRKDTSLWIQFNPESVPSSAPAMAPQFVKQMQQSLSWSTLVTIRATHGSLGDLNTWIGLGPNLSDDYDTYDANDPNPVAWEALYNRVRLVTDSTHTSPTTLSRDYRKDDLGTSGFKAWLITPIYFLDSGNPWNKTMASGVDVRLQFPTIGTMPDNVKLSLYAATPGDYAFSPTDETELIPDLAQTPDTIVTLDWGGGEYRYKYFWVVATLRDEGSGTSLTDLPEGNPGLPRRTELSTVYPNPFNSSISVRYSIARPNRALMRIYDVLGREVTTLINESRPVGRFQVVWNAQGYASGVYFIRFDVPGEQVHQVRKIVYQK